MQARTLYKCFGSVTALLFWLCSYASYGQLVPDFSVDTTEGCAPVIIKFNNLTEGTRNTYIWDLGNGIISREKNPTTFYFDAGQYTITLTVINGSDTQTLVKKNLITVFELPAINFRTSDSTGCFPIDIQFTDLSNPVSGSIRELEWDFGDGTFSTSSVTNHTYNVAGNFTISLKVTNTFGCTQLISKPGYIKVLEGVKANFNFNPGLTCNPPATIQFSDSSGGTNINQYQWNFGDGSTSDIINPTHVYTNEGSYSVSLAVANATGCADTITKENLVRVGALKASFAYQDTLCQSALIRFTNTSATQAEAVLWTFGDGTTSTQSSPAKVFQNAGKYKVMLTIFSGGCSTTHSEDITVLPLPTAGFTNSSVVSTCSQPITVSFTGLGADIKSYLWSFGDGTTSSAVTPSHEYSVPGLFGVKLEVVGNNGCKNQFIKNNLVYYGPPTVLKINGAPYRGCTPHTANLSANIYSPEPVSAYLWTFGDSATSSEVAPSHIYPNEGSYKITLELTTVNGCKTKYEMSDAIVLSARPTPAFSATPTKACAFELIKFSDSTKGSVTSWIWNFGDGGGSTEQNPLYSYKDTGTFTVTLVASNNACVDSFKLVDYIYIDPPIAKFTPTFNCNSPAVRQFEDNSIGATTWKWNFGDQSSSEEQSPSHTFPGSGLYDVELEVSNGACKHTVVQQFWVIDEKPELTVLNPSNCKNTTTLFSAGNINAALIDNFKWEFGDGIILNNKVPSANYAYSGSGSFNPSLTITDKNGCTKTVGSNVRLNVLGPKAAFDVQPNACIQSNVTFNSPVNANQPIAKYVWDYGDGTRDTVASGPFTHQYLLEGRFDVKLSVIDSLGCMDTLLKKAAVWVTKPVANFKISDSLNCLQKEIKLTNQSTGYNLKYQWTLGDGTTSQQQNVTHRYAAENQYTVSLAITDEFGCTDSLYRPNAIRVAEVEASMRVSDSASSCPPFIMKSWNTSKNFTSFYWDFDDGSFSNLDSPSHYYNIPGDYRLKLVVTGYGNCRDTAFKTISLKGPSGQLKYSPNNICSPGTVSFTGTTRNRASFIWDFGDGTTRVTTEATISHRYINPGRYKPRLLLVDVAGCQVPIPGKDTITISRANANIKWTTSAYCDTASVQFFDSSIASLDEVTKYVWSFGDGMRDSINKNPLHVYATPGDYKVSLRVFTKKGCTDVDSTTTRVKVVSSPAINIIGDEGVCMNVPVSFSGKELVNDTALLTWKWDYGNTASATGQNPAPYTYTSAGNYSVKAQATNRTGCSTSAVIPFEVYPTPMVDAGADTLVCLGQNTMLRASGADTYIWTSQPSLSCTNCANPTAQPINEALYRVIGKTIQGCVNTDSINVRVIKPFAIRTSFADTLCLGESVRLFATGSDQYSWSPAAGLNQANIAEPVARPDTTTNYRVIVSDKFQCFADTGYVKVVVYPIPKFNIAEDNYTLTVGNSVKIVSTSSPDITRWRWTPYLGLSCHDCPQPIASPRTTTPYRVQVWNGGGCTAEEQVSVTVLCNNSNVFIPNTFSPNGDGMNDVFFVRGKGVTIRSVTIFNRWGLVVFQKTNLAINDEQSGWNGTANSVMQTPDVYVYKVDVVCENNEVFSLKGNVTLIR